MKIIYTTHQFYPEYGAGTELLTYMTAAEMSKKGHVVQIASGFPSEIQPDPINAFDQYIYDGLTVQRYKHSNAKAVNNQCIMEAEHNNVLVKKWFRQFVKKFKPDLVHVFHLQRLSASILEVCHELNIPFVITVTDFWMICPTTQLLLQDNRLCEGPQPMVENCVKHLASRTQKSAPSFLIQKLPDFIIRLILQILNCLPLIRIGPLSDLHALNKRGAYILEGVNHAKRIFVTNLFMKSTLQTHGVYSNIISKMPFGIPPIKKKNGLINRKDKSLQIGFIGTLNYHKGAHVLLKAARLIPDTNKIRFYIYGSRKQFSDYVQELDAIAKNDNRISFKGIFKPDLIGDVLSTFDALVIPSLWYENTPLILLQAQAAKVPVIATDLGGMNEIVRDGENGYLIEPGNANQLATLITALIEDISILDKFRAKIKDPMFTNQYVDELERHYQKIINEGLETNL